MKKMRKKQIHVKMLKYFVWPFLQKYQHLSAYFSHRDEFHLYKHFL